MCVLLFAAFLGLASAALPLPFWTAPWPNASAPLGGYSRVPNGSTTVVFRGSEADGYYNHAAMIGLANNTITISWKNGIGSNGEDAPGQRVKYSQSLDGVSWSAPAVLFPNMSSPANPATQMAGPFAMVNGHLYASSTPGQLTHPQGGSQGAQFCLWPDGLDPRNAGPPGQLQPVGSLMLRRVRGLGDVGPVFWASASPPAALAAAAAAAGVLQLAETDAETRADVAALVASASGAAPCDSTSGTAKCEACDRGCQDFLHPRYPADTNIANERTHWLLPGGGDILVYRTNNSVLYASARASGGSWPVDLTPTNLPNDNSNINAGALPDGRTFIVANAVPHHVRDPLTIALASDGLNFSSCAALMTCHDIAGGNSSCRPRNPLNGNVGPSYPQTLAVVAPAPELLRGFYVVATNNKEDVVVSRFPFSAFDGM